MCEVINTKSLQHLKTFKGTKANKEIFEDERDD